MMSIETSLRDPKLPPELEYRIFEIAALARPTGIPRLMLVARRVKYWIEPLLYRVVLFHSPSDEHSELGLPAFTQDSLIKMSDAKRQHIRHLFLDVLSKDHGLESWILSCTGLTNLFAYLYCTPEKIRLLSGLSGIHYLTIEASALSG
ncbi:hypothetical protein MSAN_02422100 [Mycena sanguinolenta]|uniref:Uncharacterized protein n=1 Tax=Mycena sanguinolenta TaxID=230812 RepID=A0A8H6X302_9AGAR|nr:hypothetical protein MSAN_02422100 [Mycena sanguinolenta]